MNWEQVGDNLAQLKGKTRAAGDRLTGGLGQVVVGKGEEAAEGTCEGYEGARDRAASAIHDLASWARPRNPATIPVAEGLTLIGLGAGLMYFLDPERGRRRRALVRDQIVHALNVLDDAIGVASRDVRNRSRGLWAGARALPTRLMGEEVPDGVLEARVRSTMGRYVSHARSIEVVARGGRVTLRGPILAHEVDNLMRAVASIPGVAGVEDSLEVHERPGEMPALEGGRDRTGVRPELWQVNWSPTARLLVGSAGGALLLAGARRRSMARLTLGALGAGLLVRAVTNIPARCLLTRAHGRAMEPQKASPPEAARPPGGAEWPQPGHVPARSPGP